MAVSPVSSAAAEAGGRDRERRALIYGLAAVLGWSTVASAFKVALGYQSPLQLVAVASLVSTLVLAFAVMRKGLLPNVRVAWQKNWRFYLVLGFVNPFLYYFVLFSAYELLPAQQAMALNYSWGVTMALLAVPVLGNRLLGRDLAACLISYFGVLVIATGGDLLGLKFDAPVGVALALASTVLWASYWLLNTRMGGVPAVNLLLCFLCGLPWLVLALTVTGDWSWMPLQGWLAAVYVGLFEMGISFLLWQAALANTSHVARISNLIYLSPPISLVLIALIVGEQIKASTGVGLIFILAGVALQQLRRRNK
ncbi:DMT family transporter [Biformimicrobium ophioploci]|uniref:DMT family transporter n=1 Tax=Biformimicrobium ophioploci TaxID=3036711 RepID=A0ABQ6M1D0_9GAMM|nr:DMT family transporter [Microbulbifer sp. NKW57]GMG88096.1 DMT family transporter [Microbulbifer sp. NKW57]